MTSGEFEGAEVIGMVVARPSVERRTGVVNARCGLVCEASPFTSAPAYPRGDDFLGYEHDVLAYPSDFAPVKANVDVVVVGAYEAPREVAIVVGAFRRRVRVTAKRSAHALLGPVHPADPRRAQFAGTHDAKWLAEQWPSPPSDLDPRYYNAAQPEMQIERLRGDEAITLVGLHPDHDVLHSQLPGIAPRLLLADEHANAMVDVPLRLDTLIVHADTLELTLVWRGAVPEGAPSHHTHVVAEPIGEARDVRHHQADLRARIAPPPVDMPAAPPQNDNEAEAAAAFERDKQAALTELRTMMANANASAEVLAIVNGTDDPQVIADELLATLDSDPAVVERIQHEERARIREQLAEHGHDPTLLDQLEATPEPTRSVDRQQVAAQVAAGESLAGRDLRGLDLSELDLSQADLAGALLTDARLVRTKLVSAKLQGAILSSADLRQADLSYADLTTADLTGARLAESIFTGATITSALFADSDASDVTFVAAQAQEAFFQRMQLDRARFDRAVLTAALFEQCSLDGTRFVEATLERTSLSQCTGDGVDVTGALANEVRAERCTLTGLVAPGLVAERSAWVDCTLTAAHAPLARLPAAVFLGSDLTHANLRGADLRDCMLSHAVLRDAMLHAANLFRARLDHADLRAADMSNASLVCADLLFSQREKARFDGAHVYRTILDPRTPTLAPGV